MYKLIKRKIEGCGSSNKRYQEFFTREELEYIKIFLIKKRETVKAFDRGEYTTNLNLIETNGRIPLYEFLEIWSYIDLLKLDYPNYKYTKLEEDLRDKCKEEYFKKKIKKGK